MARKVLRLVHRLQTTKSENQRKDDYGERGLILNWAITAGGKGGKYVFLNNKRRREADITYNLL